MIPPSSINQRPHKLILGGTTLSTIIISNWSSSSNLLLSLLLVGSENFLSFSGLSKKKLTSTCSSQGRTSPSKSTLVTKYSHHNFTQTRAEIQTYLFLNRIQLEERHFICSFLHLELLTCSTYQVKISICATSR